MTVSPLATGTVAHHNKFSSRQGKPVLRVIQHHWAGVNGGEETLANPGNKKSANYLVYSDGTIKVQVPEEYRAWTSGSFAADGDAITIECQNSQVGGDWPVTAAAQRAIEALLADIAERHGWGGIAKTNYRGHREFQATACPGPHLWNRRSDIRKNALNILTGKKNSNVPSTPPSTNKTDWQLADEVLSGLHGNGDARRRSLGNRYSKVQALVNQRLGAGNSSAVTAPRKSVDQLVDEVLAGAHGNGDARRRSLGDRYAEVQKAVNRRLGAGNSTTGPGVSGGPNISQLADEVIRGKHGNGDARKKSLGRHYAEVQREVNRRLLR